MDFGMKLVIPLIDTYLVVLLAIDYICGKNIVLNQKTLIKELHSSFKTLYTENETIPYLCSCIKEVIKTAMERYNEARFIETKCYASNTGDKTYYMTSPAANAEKINTLLTQLQTQRNWSEKAKNEIINEVENAILRT